MGAELIHVEQTDIDNEAIGTFRNIGNAPKTVLFREADYFAN